MASPLVLSVLACAAGALVISGIRQRVLGWRNVALTSFQDMKEQRKSLSNAIDRVLLLHNLPSPPNPMLHESHTKALGAMLALEQDVSDQRSAIELTDLESKAHALLIQWVKDCKSDPGWETNDTVSNSILELKKMDNRLSNARHAYNHVASNCNALVGQFPHAPVAWLFRLKPLASVEIGDSATLSGR